MMRQRFLIMGLLFVLSATVVLTATECNSADLSNKDKVVSTQAKSGNSQEDDKNKNEKKTEDYVVENQVLKYAVKSYQESVEGFKWAMGVIVTLIGILAAAVGYVIVRYSREYKEAVSEAKEASKEANRYAEKAEEKLAEIDKKVEGKLKEIEGKGKAQIEAFIKVADKRREESRKEAERQRRVIELWNEGFRAAKNEDYESAANKFKQIAEDFKVEDAGTYNNWGIALSYLAKRKEGDERGRLFAEVFGKYEKAVAIKPDFHEAYNNWGTALSELAKCKEGDEAERLFAEAFDKYEKAVGIKSVYYEAYYGWGATLLDLALRKEGEDAERLFTEAVDKFEKAVAIKPNYHEAYNGWGAALSELAKREEGDEAERLFAEAFGKYEKAVAIKPDFHEAYNNWGAAFLYLAKRKQGAEQKTLLEKAKEKCLKAESIKRGTGAYNLACANCLLGDEEECKKWLKVGEGEGTLATRKKAMEDEDLKGVRDKEWFKEIRWKGK
jgi:tetratricopeptide (TPR) repeat protein